MKNLLAGTSLLASVLLVASCKKEKPDPAGPYFPAQAKTALAALAEPLQTFTVTAGTDTVIVGSKGTKVHFYANSFLNDTSGAVITSGTVNIGLREVYTAGDRIRNGVPTTLVSGELLTSGGSTLVLANQNGRAVRARRYGLSFRQPAETMQAMQLFTAVEDTAGFGLDWVTTQDGPGTFAPGTRKDSGVNNFFYVFDSVNSFNWINCDYFYSSTQPRTTVKIVVTDPESTPTNTVAFLVFPTISSVARSYAYDAGTRTYRFAENYAVPVGLPVRLAVLSKRGEDYYFKATPVQNVSNDMEVIVTPDRLSAAGVIAALAAL